MSVTKDSTTGKWMSQIRVKDWTGKTIHKKKRGFSTKKEAIQWEQEYIGCKVVFYYVGGCAGLPLTE